MTARLRRPRGRPTASRSRSRVAVRVHHVDIGIARAETRERDLLAVGRPRGRRSRAVMGQLGHPAPVYVHHVDVSVTAECDLSAIGRPGPREAVVGKHSLTAPVRVDQYDRGRATAGNPAERDLLAIRDRKSTRLNSSHGYISYAVFCLKKKKNNKKLF